MSWDLYCRTLRFEVIEDDFDRGGGGYYGGVAAMMIMVMTAYHSRTMMAASPWRLKTMVARGRSETTMGRPWRAAF